MPANGSTPVRVATCSWNSVVLRKLSTGLPSHNSRTRPSRPR